MRISDWSSDVCSSDLLGGKSANLIFADADLDKAAAMAAGCSLVPLAGQGCVLPTRVYAQSAIFDEFVERVRAHAQTFPLGDPLDMATVIGPVINAAAAQRIMGVSDRAEAETGREACRERVCRSV